MQRNWIGRSTGNLVLFSLCSNDGRSLEAFTSKPDNLDEVKFIALSPEHPDIQSMTIPSLSEAMTEYLLSIELRSVSKRNKAFCSGCFTGSYVLHPLSNAVLPIWVTDHATFEGGSTVALGMPNINEQDKLFFDQLGLAADSNMPEQRTCNAAPLLTAQPATRYRMRDAVFGRQRYWGEPIPIYYDDDGIAHALPDDQLPLELPQIDAYLPTEEGEPPLHRAQGWRYGNYEYEKTTMPGWAGSSWYFLRYADPQSSTAPIGSQAANYWNSVDLYVGGAEHATGHLLYARFWTHFLKDLGIIEFAEPFKRVVCQGMIQGSSAIIYRDVESQTFVSAELVNGRKVQPLHIDVKLVNENNAVDLPRLREWRESYRHVQFECIEGQFFCDRQIEKMSKSKHNVVNPDDLIRLYGADAFRLHSLFLGPIEQSAVWSTDSIDGASKFVQRVWRLFADDNGQSLIDTAKPTREELKLLHTAIDKVRRDTESLSFNTAIAALMVCATQLKKLKCHKYEILAPFLQLLHPFAPFMTQELWTSALGRNENLTQSTYPTVDTALLEEEHFLCPVTINGKLRSHVTLSPAMSAEQMEKCVFEDATIQKWIGGQTVKKIIVIKGRLVNLVLA
nr:class I tRNA ligase family protein [uncultured Pseudomonas sp.]